MPTINDLRVVLHDLESNNHDSDAILTAVLTNRRRTQRPRWAVPALAAAAVVALAIGPVAYLNHDRPGGQGHHVTTADGTKTNLLDRYLVGVGTVPAGLRVLDLGVTTNSQTTALVNTDGTILAEIEVAQQAPSRNPIRQPTPLAFPSVVRSPTTGPARLSSGATRQQDGTVETVTWTAPSGFVLSVQGPSTPTGASGRPATPLTHDQLLKVAGSLSLDATRPVRTPLGVTYLPPNYHVEGIATTPTTPGHVETIIDLVYGGGVNVSLQIMLGAGIPVVTQPNQQQISVGRFTGTYSPTAVATVLNDGQRSVEVYYNAGENGDSGTGTNLSLDEVTRIVQGLQFASSITDPSTWFNATNALPR